MDDHAILVTIVTAFLIREGGKIAFPADEWDRAVAHNGSLYFNKKEEDDPMLVALMRRVEEVVQ